MAYAAESLMYEYDKDTYGIFHVTNSVFPSSNSMDCVLFFGNQAAPSVVAQQEVDSKLPSSSSAERCQP